MTIKKKLEALQSRVYEDLQKSLKSDYHAMVKDHPQGAEVAKWAAEKLPNRNWGSWYLKSFKKDPAIHTEENRKSLEHFMGMQHLKEVKEHRFDPAHDFKTGMESLKAAEAKGIERTSDKERLVPAEGARITEPRNGMAWYDLGRGSCSKEGVAMGHCGNEPSEVEGDHLIAQAEAETKAAEEAEKKEAEEAKKKSGSWTVDASPLGIGKPEDTKKSWVIEPIDLIKSDEDLEKGLKEAALGAAIAAGISVSAQNVSATQDKSHVGHSAERPVFAVHPELKHIAFIESSGGKNKNHKTVESGLNTGHTAGGSTGLMPLTIKDIVRQNPSLHQKYGHLRAMSADEITDFTNKNEHAESEIANAHWNRLINIFPDSPSRRAYAWRRGITASLKASDEKVESHPYVKKFNELRNASVVASMGKSEGLEKGKNGEWEKDGYSITHHEDRDEGFPEVRAWKDGKLVGKMHYGDHPEYEGALMAGHIEIVKEHRRRGLATAMYHRAEEAENRRFEPSYDQTKDAKKFWNSYISSPKLKKSQSLGHSQMGKLKDMGWAKSFDGRSKPNRLFGNSLLAKSEDWQSKSFNEIKDSKWNGMNLRPMGSSLKSIASSFNNYKLRRGVFDVPYEHFSDPKKHFYAAGDQKRSEQLASQISHNKEIEPLIVAIDKKGPYILEGQHRFVALHANGHKSFPAMIVEDHDSHGDGFGKSQSLGHAQMGKSEELEKAPLIFDADHAEEKSPYREVWRMQDEHGMGPYGPLGLPMKTHQPHPSEDSGFSRDDRVDLSHRGNHGDRTVRFGFENEEQMNSWFTPEERQALSAKGYKPTKVKAAKVWSSGKQVFYLPHVELEKRDYYGRGLPHGWISPQGEFHEMGSDEDHREVIAHHIGMPMEHEEDERPVEEAYKKGWVSFGHAGEMNIQGHHEVLNNRSHPAMKMARNIVSAALDNAPEESELTVHHFHPETGSKMSSADSAHFARHGTFRPTMTKAEEAESLAGLRKSEGGPLKIRSPKTGYRVGSDRWIPVHAIKGEVTEQKGEWPVPAHMDHTHEAIWVTHKPEHALRYHFGAGASDAIEEHQESGAEPPEDHEHRAEFDEYLEMTKRPRAHVAHIDLAGAKPYIDDGDHGYLYVRPIGGVKKSEGPLSKALNPFKTFPEEITEEHERLIDVLESPSHEDDKKEAEKQKKELQELAKVDIMEQGALQGWISPKGEFHPVEGDEDHFQFIARTRNLDPMEVGEAHLRTAYNDGYLSLGHAGGHNIVGSKKVLSDARNPAMRKARELLRQSSSPEVEITEIESNKPLKACTSTLCRYGKIKPLRKADQRGSTLDLQLKIEGARLQMKALRDSEQLEKMSRPSIKFPGLPKLSTRPDQEVQLIETGRQKELFGRKVAQAHSPSASQEWKNKSAKHVAGRFSRNTLGVEYDSKTGSKAAALAGKMRSRFEDGDEKDQAKLAEHREKRVAAIKEHNAKVDAWQSEYNSLRSAHLQAKTPEERTQTYSAVLEHQKKVPKWKAPTRKPVVKRKATKELPLDQMKSRGRGVESTIHHEALHYTLGEMRRHYGSNFGNQVRRELVGKFEPSAMDHVKSYITEKKGYKRNNPHFEEELLTHARDILVNPKTRKGFSAHIGEKAPDVIKQLKSGLQAAYEHAKTIKPPKESS